MTVLLVLASLIITVQVSGCSAIASYLIYQWIEDEFNGGGDGGEEPQITKIFADRETIYAGDAVILEVEAEDNNDSADDLEYFWTTDGGTLVSPTSRITVWNVPNEAKTYMITVLVRDTDDNTDSQTVDIEVQPKSN